MPKASSGGGGGTHHVVEIGILHGFHGFRGFLGEGSLDGLRDWGRSCGEGGGGRGNGVSGVESTITQPGGGIGPGGFAGTKPLLEPSVRDAP